MGGQHHNLVLVNITIFYQLPFTLLPFTHLRFTHLRFYYLHIYHSTVYHYFTHLVFFQADKLSSWLGIDVDEDQVVMSHSPLKMFRDYHDKHVLVIGQGPVDDIARALGFRRVTTIQQLRHAFPTLDNVDHKRRRGESFQHK